MTLIPRIIHYFWIYPDNDNDNDLEPNDRLQACRNSMLLLHPEWTILEWDIQGNALDIRSGRIWNDIDLFTGLRNNTQINPDEELAKLNTFKSSFITKEAILCDFLKLSVLYLYGGFVIDYDMYCLKPLDKFLNDDLVFAQIKPDVISEALIGCRPLDVRIKKILNDFVNTGKPEIGQVTANLSGYCYHNSIHSYPTDYFIGSTRRDGKPTITENTCTVHLWSNHEYNLQELADIADLAKPHVKDVREVVTDVNRKACCYKSRGI